MDIRWHIPSAEELNASAALMIDILNPAIDSLNQFLSLNKSESTEISPLIPGNDAILRYLYIIQAAARGGIGILGDFEGKDYFEKCDEKSLDGARCEFTKPDFVKFDFVLRSKDGESMRTVIAKLIHSLFETIIVQPSQNSPDNDDSRHKKSEIDTTKANLKVLTRLLKISDYILCEAKVQHCKYNIIDKDNKSAIKEEK